MFNPGDLVRCRFLSGLYTPLGVIIREVVTKDPLVYEVLVMHRSNLPGGTSSPKRQCVNAVSLEVVNESR